MGSNDLRFVQFIQSVKTVKFVRSVNCMSLATVRIFSALLVKF